MRIFPAQCTLTQGQSQQFLLKTLDDPGTIVAGAKWSVASGPGKIDAGGLYTAPAAIAQAVEVTLAASDTEKATVQLVPVEVVLFPATASLREGESQQFTARVPGTTGAGADAVLWSLSPANGGLKDGLYVAPATVAEDRDIEIIATSVLDPRKSSKATVRLVSKPMDVRHTAALFFYLVAVFALAAVLINLWPPPVAPADLVDRARAMRIAADAAVATARTEEARAVAEQDQDEALLKATPDSPGLIRKKDDAAAKANNLATNLKLLVAEAQSAADHEGELQDPKVKFLHWRMSRDVNLLCLVLIGGALGSFIYTARSFVDFVGNGTIRGSWTVWYLMYPFIGAALALIFYLAIRGGFLSTASSSADINLFGLVAISGLVGMFSKQATSKLGEVFTTLFKTDKEAELKDKLDKQPAKPATPVPGTPDVNKPK